MSEIGKNFKNFNFLRSILSHFPTRNCEYFSRAYCIMISIFFERLPGLWLPNDSDSTLKFHKNVKMLSFLDWFGVILKGFWSQTLQPSLQKMWFIYQLLLSLLIVLELLTNSFGNCTEIATKCQNITFPKFPGFISCIFLSQFYLLS